MTAPVRASQTSCACGFVSKVTTEALAARALHLHSCARHHAIAEQQARGVARRDRVDRAPKPCLHKEAQHEHGSRACYVLDRCRCTPCAVANAAVERYRIRQTAYGRWHPYVDAGPAREHVQALRAAGLGWKRIAAHSGVATGTMSKLLYGHPQRGLAPTKRIRAKTEAALLAVTADVENLGTRVPVDATGTRRRLQALVALGWSKSELARRLGRLPTNFIPVMDRAQCSAHTVLEVRALYEQLRDTRPPEDTHVQKVVASRARNYAAARGWPPPLWWDDSELDDPAAAAADLDEDDVVDEIALERFLAGEDLELTEAERRQAAVRSVAGGVPVTRTAVRLRVHPRSVRQWVADAAPAGVAS